MAQPWGPLSVKIYVENQIVHEFTVADVDDVLPALDRLTGPGPITDPRFKVRVDDAQGNGFWMVVDEDDRLALGKFD